MPRRDPADKPELEVAVMSCNSSSTPRPRAEIVASLRQADPDDHDVGHPNLWGAGGRKAERKDGADGGCFYPAAYVNMVQRQQTWHLPDPVDPAPVAQGIGVFFTRLVLGGLDCNGWPQRGRDEALRLLQAARDTITFECWPRFQVRAADGTPRQFPGWPVTVPLGREGVDGPRSAGFYKRSWAQPSPFQGPIQGPMNGSAGRPS
ncbi:MAG: hypothetical protein O3A37_01140 [Planctomycetota bacterium]|nr:hypothetical protein [Planctomycetota bacterium]